MKRINTLFVTMILGINSLMAQFQLNTVPPLNGGNGSAGITFGITSTQTIIIDTIFCSFSGAGQTDVWYSTTDVFGQPNMSASNGWTQIGAATIPVASGTGSIVPIPLNIGLTILPGTSYRFFVNGSLGAPLVYSNTGTTPIPPPAGTFTDGVLTIETGDNVGYGGPAPSFGNHPRQFNGGIKYTLLGGMNDAAVLSIDSPGVFCGGPQNIYATIANYGGNQITSVNVNWSLGGILQTPLSYTGTLDTLNGAGSQSAQVFLGSANFAPGSTEIKVWTSNPNGVADTSNFNDTTSRSVGPSIQGALTVNPGAAVSGTNFHSIANAISTVNALGLCGPATITVSPGLYNEGVLIGSITGADSVNTLTIDGGSSSTTTIDGTSNGFYTVAFDGAKYVTLTNFRIINNNATTQAVNLVSGSEYNTISNCEIKVSTTSTSSTVRPIGSSGSLTSATTNGAVHYNTIENNRVVGGYYGIYFYGGSGNLQTGNKVIGNQIDSAYYYGVYGYYQDAMEVLGNTCDITTRSNINADGFYGLYNTNGIFIGNYFYAPDYGFYISNASTLAGPTYRKTQIINNMIISQTDYGMYLYSVDQVDLFHNSITAAGTLNPAMQIGISTTYPISNYDMRNNIFAASSTEALEILTAPDTIFTKNDNNAYYTMGATLIRANNTNYPDLPSYKTAQPGYNLGSLEGDPQFLSPTDLHIIGAFVNGMGDNSVGVTEDIDGDSRPLAGSTTVDIGADEFSPPLCPPVANLNSTNATLNSIDLFWDGTPLATWQYEIVVAGAVQGTGTMAIVASDSITVTGLMASTTYQYYVREICGRGDTSLWLGPQTFNTANGVPYFQDFQNFGTNTSGTISTEGWYTLGTPVPNWQSGSSTSSTLTGPAADHTIGAGGTFLYLETSGGALGDFDDLWSPPIYIDPSYNAIELSFWYHMYGGTMGNLEVYVETGSTSTLITSIIGQQHPAQANPWTNFATTLSGYAGQSIQIRFKGIRGSSFDSDMAIDDVALNVLAPLNAGVISVISPQLPICPGSVTPVVGVKNFGTDTLTSVKVLWDVNGFLDSVTYNGTILPGDTAPVTLASLTISSSIIYDIAFYTKSPNNGVDAVPADDTLSYDGLRTGLSGTFTIDAGSPASSTNWQSFSSFASDISNYGLCGAVTVNVVPLSGPYNEQFEISDLNGSSSTNTLTINGNGETIAFGSTNTNQRAVITFDNASWITIDNLDIDATGSTYGFGIQNINGTHHITITNCTIDAGSSNTSTNFAGIVNSGSRTSATSSGGNMHDILIDGNTIIGGYLGISSYGNTASLDQYNITISNNTIEDFYIYGVYVLYTDSAKIEHNDISRANRSSVTTFYGAFLSTGCLNSVINANEIHNNSDAAPTSTSTAYPIYIAADATAGNDNYVSNNVIRNINSNGTIYAIYSVTAEYGHIVNNTVSLDEAGSTSSSACRGIFLSGNANTDIVNNIISISRGGTGAKHGIYLSGTPLSCDYNDVYITSAAGTNSYGYFGSNQATLSDWQSNTSYGANSYDVDPKYDNLPIGDLTPTSGLINNVGTPVAAVTTDFNGVARGSIPDLGAIEFTPPASDNLGFVSLAAPMANVDSCYGAAEDVIVEVINAGGTVLDFTSSQATITVNVSGATTQTLTLNLNNNNANGGNPLPIGGVVNLNMGTINMTNAGAYNFSGLITMVSDTFPQNDTLNDIVNLLPTTGGTIAGSDTICLGDTVTISTSNYVGSLQWQSSSNGTTWSNVTGADSSDLTISPTSLTYYRVIACGSAPSDTLSVLPISLSAPTAIGDTAIAPNCNTAITAYGIASSANPNATFEWYDDAVAGNKISTGGSYVLSNDGDSIAFTATPQALMPVADTLWVEEVTSGGAGGPTLLITEMDLGGPDALEIQNVSSQPVDVTGWAVAISNNYTNINAVNANVQILNGMMAPGATMFWTDGTVNPWGSNILWNPGAYPTFSGWILIIDNQGNVVDFIASNWLPSDIQSFNVTINGFTITDPIGSGEWSGNGLDGTSLPTGSSFYRIGNSDNNDASDFIQNVINLGATNNGLILPFAGGGCVSPRTMVNLRVECATGIEDQDLISALTISPNPSNGLFKVNINVQESNAYQLKIKDLSGKLVYEDRLVGQGQISRDLDLTHLAKGVYLIQFQSGNAIKNEKVIIH